MQAKIKRGFCFDGLYVYITREEGNGIIGCSKPIEFDYSIKLDETSRFPDEPTFKIRGYEIQSLIDSVQYAINSGDINLPTKIQLIQAKDENLKDLREINKKLLDKVCK